MLSVPLVDSLYVKAALGFASPADQTTGQDLDYVTWQLGAGIGLPIATGFDLVLEAGIAHQELTGARFLDSFDGYGYYASPGVRWAIGDLIELNGGVTFMNIDSDSNVSVDLKALLHLLPSVSLWGGASFSEEVNQYGVGLRLSF